MQLVILGYHRSGTSAATQHLVNAGLFVGQDLLGANASNPHGHFEDLDFIHIHEQLFDENGESWLAPNPFVPIFSPALRQKIATIVGRRCAAHDVWGFKDPRACLFVDAWRTFLPSPRFLVCLRHYRACVDSVVRRALAGVRTTVSRSDARTQMLLASDHDAIARSWVAHMLPLLRLMRHHPDLVHTVMLGRLSGSIAQDLNDRFGFSMAPVPLSDTFDAALFKRDEEVEISLSREVADLAERVWSALLAAHDDMPTRQKVLA